MTAERGEETTGEKGEARRSGFMGLKERGRLHNRTAQGGGVSAGIVAAASPPESLAQIIQEGGYAKQDTAAHFYFSLFTFISGCAGLHCGEQGLPFAAVCRLLMAAASALQSTRSRALGLQSWQLVGSAVADPGLESTSSIVVALGLRCF